FALGSITFEKPDPENFEGLALAYQAARAGGSLPTVFNAANERAVALFLAKKIGYLQIPELIRGAMEAHKVIKAPNVQEILEAEQFAYDWIASKGF
ncbi:MAG: 1-deoxy-D-xylulose-5-phosphate reductoisomerase, partial [Lachnospiraceae bacterium]|nr:1-deoxy-D-xylulose-5-phosphate reductoisomerase [Lachnospiraceae bacterium]